MFRQASLVSHDLTIVLQEFSDEVTNAARIEMLSWSAEIGPDDDLTVVQGYWLVNRAVRLLLRKGFRTSDVLHSPVLSVALDLCICLMGVTNIS